MITDARSLDALVQRLSNETLLAFDTESNSLFAYRERVCLIQVSTRDADYLIDPLAIDSMEPLRPIFASRTIEKVFHAAEYDVMCMKRDFGFEFNALFDTMLAARVLGRKQFGLGALLEEFFGVQADKRYQKADWSLRPLPVEQLAYAQQDTHYLPQLRNLLHAELAEKGRLREAGEMFDALARVPAADNQFDPEGYWRIHSARDFDRRQMAILRELYLWRDQTAQAQDVPPFKIMGDTALTGIVGQRPRTPHDLGDVRELSTHQLRRYTTPLLAAVDRGMVGPLPARPERPRPLAPIIQARYDALHTWRKEQAAARGVESDVIMSKESMWAMARNPPFALADLDDVPGLGPWRRAEYGAAVIDVLAGVQLIEDGVQPGTGPNEPSESGS